MQENDCPLLIIDPKGLTYRPLTKHFDGVVVLPFRKIFRANLFCPPPGVPVSEWAKGVSYLISELGIKHGRAFLMKLLNRLYEAIPRPHMGDVMRFVNQADPKRYGVSRQWIQTVQGVMIRIFESLKECLDAKDNQR